MSSEPMTPERLAEIREATVIRRRLRSQDEMREELIAEIDRLAAALDKATKDCIRLSDIGQIEKSRAEKAEAELDSLTEKDKS